ncbi:DUF7534 family protein [Halovenus sp. HT40]|uniref:DUF7534 family protein n=1 Tax=Halovenus sp. HT40 TaxID=3126691 RepID=UPI00300F2DD3
MDTAAARRFLGRVGGLVVVAFVLGSTMTPPDPYTQLVYATGAVPIVLVAAYVLVYRTDSQHNFGRFLIVSTAVGLFIWFVGSVLTPTGIGIGGGLAALAAALVCGHAIVYQDRRAALSSGPG